MSHSPLSWPLMAALPDLVRCLERANTRDMEPQAEPRPRAPLLPAPERPRTPPSRAASHSPGLDSCSTDLMETEEVFEGTSKLTVFFFVF